MLCLQALMQSEYKLSSLEFELGSLIPLFISSPALLDNILLSESDCSHRVFLELFLLHIINQLSMNISSLNVKYQ